jgi:hypothetical protein
VRDNPYNVVITATDRAGASAQLTFPLLIFRPNSPPFVIGVVPEQQAIEGIAYELELAGNFDDLDEGDSLLFSAQFRRSR